MLYLIIPLFLLTSCQSQNSTIGLHHMNPKLWEKDLDYLNKKIQKEFVSFDLSIKKKFHKKVNLVKSQLSSIDNSATAIKVGQLLASLGDGHTEMSVLQKATDFGRLPIAMYFFEEGLYIVAAHKGYEHYIGHKVLKIGNKTVPELVEALKTVMTYDNKYEILHAGPTFLVVPEVLSFLKIIEDKTTVLLTLETEDAEVLENQNIEPVKNKEYTNVSWTTIFDVNAIKEPLRRKNRGQDYWFKYIEEDKTMYFNFSRNNDQKGQPTIKSVVSAMFKEINIRKAEKLIIDLRANRGGNYKKSRPLINAIKKHSSINKEGKLYAITGRTTFSAAMVTSIFLKKETNAILVGEPSRGHPNKTDNVEYMTLPNSNLQIEYTTKVKRHWAALKDLDHVPVDVPIPSKFKDYKGGTDATLNYILKS